MKTSFPPPLLFLAIEGYASIAMAQSPGTFIRTGNMTTARDFHTATLLLNGKVLIAGGARSTSLSAGLILASAELYDPGSGTFSLTGDMITARRLHTATLLPDGRLLIAGGYGTGGALASAELYDYSAGTFTATGDMITARGGHTAILLPNGKVLVVGGYAPAELYDPATGLFSSGGSYVGTGSCDFCAPATLLSNGKVLFAGQSPAQLYDPVTNSFSATGTSPDLSATALLPNGKVLFAGGEGIGRYSTAVLYEPATGTFALTGSMAWSRVWHSLNLLPDGTVLAAGGETDKCTGNPCRFTLSAASAELYDPSTGTFAATGEMAAPRETHTATLLNDGRVLIAGGIAYGGIDIFFGSLATAELYNPQVLVPTPVLFSLSQDGRGQGAILHAATHQVVLPSNPAVAGEALEIYGTGLMDGSVIPPQIAIGGRLADILFFGKAPGYAGLNQVNVRVPSGIAPATAAPVRLNYLGRPSNEVTIGVR